MWPNPSWQPMPPMDFTFTLEAPPIENRKGGISFTNIASLLAETILPPIALNGIAQSPRLRSRVISSPIDRQVGYINRSISMSMIDRYKKKGGFIQLLILLETTGSEKREKFLKMIADENPAWESEIKKKMLSLDRILSWNQSYLMEILPRIPFQSIATIIAALPTEKQSILTASLSFQDRKKVEDFLKEKKPAAGEVNSAIMKMMSEIRAMVAGGQLKFEKFDQEMVIPENIEDLLSSGRPMISDKEVEAHFASAPAGTPGAGNGGASSEELTQLRKKLVQLSQENQRLSQENVVLKDKLDQIKKIA